MDGFIESFLSGKGYAVNKNALSVIRKCDNWYANRVIREFHKRCTVQGEEYEMSRLGFAKRCCSDDANQLFRQCCIYSYCRMENGAGLFTITPPDFPNH